MNTTVKNYNDLFSIQFITRFSKVEDIFLNEHKIQPYETEYDFLPEDEQEFGGLPKFNRDCNSNACNAYKAH